MIDVWSPTACLFVVALAAVAVAQTADSVALAAVLASIVAVDFLPMCSTYF